MRNFKKLATFTYPSDLAVARSLLESMNIECYVKDELTVQVHNFYSNAIGGITLEIPENKYETAKNLLMESGFKSDLIEIGSNSIKIEEEGGFNPFKILKFSIQFIVTSAIILIIIVLILVVFYDK